MIRTIQEVLSRLAAVFRRRTLDGDFDDEFATHIDLLTEQHERRGLPRDEARRQAIIQMGGLNATRDLHREARGLPLFERFLEMIQSFRRDLVHAARSLAKARAFTAVCVLSLGIGMAPVIAVPYGTHIMNKMSSSSPPGNAEGLVEIILASRGPREAGVEWSYPDFVDLHGADTGMTIAGWAAGQSETTFRTASGEPETVYTMFVSANYFNTLGVKLVRGPGFDPAVDPRQTPEPTVIVAHELWQNRLNSDPDIVGKTLTLQGSPHVVVGIAPEGFFDSFPGGPAQGVAVPLERHPRFRADDSLRFNRNADWVHIYGRLSPGVGIEQANAAVSAITSRLAQQYPETNEFKAGSVEPYGYEIRAQLMIFQTVMFSLTGMVLLVICLNTSGMMQVRSAMRERELSIRQAIGATRGRLMRYLLSEAVILACLAGTLAAFVLLNIPPALSWWIGLPIPPDIQEAVRPDVFMVAICVGLCFVTSLVFGLLPALRFSRPVIISALKDDAGVGGLRVGRVHRLTAALQIAIAVPLLIFSGILVERFRATATTDLGFEPDGLYAARLNLDAGTSADTKDRRDFLVRSVRDNLEKASGVESVTVADGLPLDYRRRPARVSRQFYGTDAGTVAADSVFSHVTHVAGGYLNTMDIPLVRGRGITDEDREGDEPVAVISQALADRLFPNLDPIGERLTFAPEENAPQVLTVVGVTADFVTHQMTTAREQLLVPLEQHPTSNVLVIARSAAGEQPMKLTAAFKNAIRDVDPDFSPASVITGDQFRETSRRDFLANAALAGGIGGIVLALSALGIYGVVGLTVATRTREIAVRVALGASRWRVIRMILFDVVKLVMPGVAGGVIVTMAVVRLPAIAYRLGFSVSSLESLGYVFGAAIAILVAVLASLAPARRAASVQPMVAMRSQ